MEETRSLPCRNNHVCDRSISYGGDRNQNRSAPSIMTVLFFSGALLLVASVASGSMEAYAQFPSLFPPPPTSAGAGQAGGDGNAKIVPNDRSPPEIEFITTELRQGKNVLIVRITDESYLKSREVKYVDEGRIKFADLARNHDDFYNALINVEPPSGVIVIDVSDVAGNRATITKELPVTLTLQPNDFLDRLADVWRNVLAFVGLR